MSGRAGSQQAGDLVSQPGTLDLLQVDAEGGKGSGVERVAEARDDPAPYVVDSHATGPERVSTRPLPSAGRAARVGR